MPLDEKLDLFAGAPKPDPSIISTKLVRIYPKNAIVDKGPLDFEFSSDDYVDLSHTEICIRSKIVKDDGTAISIQTIVGTGTEISYVGDYVAPINNFLQGMIQSCKMQIGDVEMEDMYNLYGYSAFFDTLLNTTKEEQDTKLYNQLWIKDDPDDMDYTWTGNYTTATKGKKGAHERMLKMLLKSKVTSDQTGIWMSGRPACDMFRQKKLVPSNTPIRLSIFQHMNPAFWYMCNKDGKYKLQILEAFLQVQTVKVDLNLSIMHEKAITPKHPANYPISRKIAIPFTAKSGEQSVIIQDPTRGRFPQKMFVGFVDAKGFEGDRTKNPFNFENVGISSMQLYINGETFRPSYNSSEETINYEALFMDGQVNITPKEFEKGTTIYAFYPFMSFEDSRRNGNAQLSITFAAALTKDYKIIVYFECDDEVKITWEGSQVLGPTGLYLVRELA